MRVGLGLFLLGLLSISFTSIMLLYHISINTEERNPMSKYQINQEHIVADNQRAKAALYEGQIITFNNTITKQRKWKPPKENMHHLCVIIPFRASQSDDDGGEARRKQLEDFVPYMRAWLQDHKIPNTIIVAEQEDGLSFNRGALLNLGFAVGYEHCDYSVFHDVDRLPTHPKNTYEFPSRPLHQCNCFGDFGDDFVGGVVIMQNEHYLEAGGFSNMYWGWGREDNDMWERLNRVGLTVDRLDATIGHYNHSKHESKSTSNGLQLSHNTKHFEDLKNRNYDPQEEGIRQMRGRIVSVKVDEPDYIRVVFTFPTNRGLVRNKGLQ